MADQKPVDPRRLGLTQTEAASVKSFLQKLDADAKLTLEVIEPPLRRQLWNLFQTVVSPYSAARVPFFAAAIYGGDKTHWSWWTLLVYLGAGGVTTLHVSESAYWRKRAGAKDWEGRQIKFRLDLPPEPVKPPAE